MYGLWFEFGFLMGRHVFKLCWYLSLRNVWESGRMKNEFAGTADSKQSMFKCLVNTYYWWSEIQHSRWVEVSGSKLECLIFNRKILSVVGYIVIDILDLLHLMSCQSPSFVNTPPPQNQLFRVYVYLFSISVYNT